MPHRTPPGGALAGMSASLEHRWPSLCAAWRGNGDTSPLSTAERARVARSIGTLSGGLTRDRALVGERYLADADLLGAYLLFYWPVSYGQASSVLGELRHRPLGRVLDVGAGPMPMGIAALDAGATAVHAIDRVDQALTLGRSLVASDGRVSTSTWDPQRGDALPAGPFDTIIAGHVFNELHLGGKANDRRAALVGMLLSRCSDGGRLVIIEPALRDTSRALLALRDLVASQGVVIHAPCLVQTPCPALMRPTDWCHAERAWTPPAAFTALAELAKLHKERLKFSYLVLSRDAHAPQHGAELFRIVSEPMPQKGKTILFGCGPAGRHPLVRRDRDANERNADFDELERGDLIRAAPLETRGDGLRIVEGSTVERVAHADEPSEPA